MYALQRYAPRASTVREVERWIRSAMPRRTPKSSPVPRMLAGLALVLAGAAAALLLSPKTGPEMRTLARKRIDRVRRSAKDFAVSHDPRRSHNGRAEAQTERSRRTEATS